MRDAGIFDGSLLVVDRSISPTAGHIVLAYVDNQPLVKRLAKSAAGWVLESANSAYKNIVPSEYGTIEVFGVVTWVLTPHAL
ncbi:LexA family transcriptional regulator, partial [Pseudomonas sp. NBRC 111142]